MLYLLFPIIALIAVFIIYNKSEAYFADDIDYESSEDAENLFKHIHNEIITENKNTNTSYYQFTNIGISTSKGKYTVENLLIGPQGIFIFNNLPMKRSISIHRNNSNFIINSLKTHLNHIPNLIIYDYDVINNDEENLNFKQQHNIIHLSQLKNMVESKKDILSNRDIQFIIGKLMIQSNIPNDSESSFAA